MRRPRQAALSLGFFISASALWAGGPFPEVQVVPWNGHKAATSLTFDGGDPSQLDVAVPELNQRHWHGTFFLIANHIVRKDEWRKVLASGHEIGNHTLDHQHAKELASADEESQVVGARRVLQKEFGIQVYTFAYPFNETSPGLKKWVESTHLLARGGNTDRYEITPDQDPDWMEIPARGTLTDIPLSSYRKWIDADYRKGGWLVWVIHGLEGTPSGGEPISQKNFEGILDDLQSKDIWVGTFLEVGSYFRAEKIFEHASVKEVDSEKDWSWDLPDHFPDRVFLKLRLVPSGERGVGKVEFRQDGRKLTPDSQGIYTIDFNLKGLTMLVRPKLGSLNSL